MEGQEWRELSPVTRHQFRIQTTALWSHLPSFLVCNTAQHTHQTEGNMWSLRKPKWARPKPLRKLQRKAFVTGQMSPPNMTKCCHISNTVQGAQAGTRDLPLARDKRLQGLCLLRAEARLGRGQREEPLSAGRTIIISIQKETKMTSVKAIIPSDVVWIYNM